MSRHTRRTSSIHKQIHTRFLGFPAGIHRGMCLHWDFWSEYGIAHQTRAACMYKWHALQTLMSFIRMKLIKEMKPIKKINFVSFFMRVFLDAFHLMINFIWMKLINVWSDVGLFSTLRTPIYPKKNVALQFGHSYYFRESFR